MEIYTSFKYPNGQSADRKYGLLIRDEVQAERVWKFVNTYSHASSESRAWKLVDLSECSAIVSIVVNAVRVSDQEHYDALLQALATRVHYANEEQMSESNEEGMPPD